MNQLLGRLGKILPCLSNIGIWRQDFSVENQRCRRQMPAGHVRQEGQALPQACDTRGFNPAIYVVVTT